MKIHTLLAVLGFCVCVGGCAGRAALKPQEDLAKAQEAATLLEEVSARMHRYYHNTDKVLFETSAEHVLDLIDMQLPGYAFAGSDAYTMDYILSLNMQTDSGNLVGGTTATLWRRNPQKTAQGAAAELYSLGIQTVHQPHIVYKYCHPASAVGRQVCDALKARGFEYKE